jgi:hypothetical protein
LSIPPLTTSRIYHMTTTPTSELEGQLAYIRQSLTRAIARRLWESEEESLSDTPDQFRKLMLSQGCDEDEAEEAWEDRCFQLDEAAALYSLHLDRDAAVIKAIGDDEGGLQHGLEFGWDWQGRGTDHEIYLATPALSPIGDSINAHAQAAYAAMTEAWEAAYEATAGREQAEQAGDEAAWAVFDQFFPPTTIRTP